MKAQFLSKLLCRPWNIAPERGRIIIGDIICRLMKNERPDEDYAGNPLPKMQIVGDVAIIPISGVLYINVPDWFKEYGFNLTDANDIAEEVEAALNNPSVSMIVQDIDSPGGDANAGEKLFDLFEAANKKKPVFSWAADGADMCSSAFYSAAPSTAIVTGPFACVGSIGTYSSWPDDSQFWKMMGIDWKVFRSGTFKGIGEDAISEEQGEYIQSIVDYYGGKFRDDVSKYRTGIKPEDMQGQYFQGQDAASRGFTAGTAKTRDAALAKFRKMI